MSLNLSLSELVATTRRTKSGVKKVHETVYHDLYQTPTTVTRSAMSKIVQGNPDTHMLAFEVYKLFVLNNVGPKNDEENRNHLMWHLDEVRKKVENGAQFVAG